MATIPISRITPIRLMMLTVCPVSASASITPMSESGSDIRIASGSRKLPNCITRIRYISRTAIPRARKMSAKISFWFLASPPSERVTPGGSCSAETRARTSAWMSPVARPWGLYSTFTTRSRSRWLITAGPSPELTRATWPRGSVVGRPSGPITISGRTRRSSARRRDSGDSRRVTSRVSPLGSTQSPTSIPAKAGRSACATAPIEMPSDPASPRSMSMLSSGRRPLLERPMSTAPRTWATSLRIISAAVLMEARSGPFTWSMSCFRPPPMSLVKTATCTPARCSTSSRTMAANSSALMSRSCLGDNLMYRNPLSTAPEVGSPIVA